MTLRLRGAPRPPDLRQRTMRCSTWKALEEKQKEALGPVHYRLWAGGDKDVAAAKSTAAMEEIRRGMSYREASERFGIPTSTLHGMVHRKGELDKRRHFSLEEEMKLKDFIIRTALIAVPRTRKQVMLRSFFCGYSY